MFTARHKNFIITKKPLKNNGSGFTLLETIISLALGILVLSIIMAVVVPGLRNIRTITRVEKLHVNGIFLLNTLTYWIKQAEDLNVSDDDTSLLEIKLPDSLVKTVTINDNSITIDSIPFNTDDIEITELIFTEMSKSVRVNLTIKTKGGEETLPITTTIAQRNSF